MTIINTPLVLLAQQCGGTFHTPGPMRAIRGMAFTFDQLDMLAERLRAGAVPPAVAGPSDNARAALEMLIREAECVAGDHHRPRYPRLDSALASARSTLAAAPAVDALDAVRRAVRDYHHDLDTRRHGDIAACNAIGAIQTALGMEWAQGAEATARAAQAMEGGAA